MPTDSESEAIKKFLEPHFGLAFVEDRACGANVEHAHPEV